MSLLSSFIEFVSKNKEWLFSGIGVTIIVAIFWIMRHVIFGKSESGKNEVHSQSIDIEDDEPNYWEAIRPLNSNYKLVSKKSNSIPAGIQTFSFEYSPYGHAHALNLKGKTVRAEIQFSCRITNVYKAMFEADDYALNFLQPQFLLQARTILERFSIDNLRDKRQEVSNEVLNELADSFGKFGFALLSVTIGAVEQINNPSNEA